MREPEINIIDIGFIIGLLVAGLILVYMVTR